MSDLRKLRIAISIWSFTPGTGGLQAHAQSLCKHLMSRGHEVVVVTRSVTKIPKCSDYLFFNEGREHHQVDGIPVRAVRINPAWKPLLWVILKLAARPSWIGLAASLYKKTIIRPTKKALEGFDIIHHVGHSKSLAGFAEAQAASEYGIPFLVQPTAHPYHFGDSPLDFQLYHKASRLLVHTNYEREFFLEKGIQVPIDIVWNGIENRTDGKSDHFRNKHGINGPMFLYIGRKETDKGYPLVVQAFRQLREKFPEAILVCMGPGTPSKELEEVAGIIELDFAEETEKHDALAACTCLCVPSSGESFGLIYMEAGLYHKPVIARNIPVLRELLGPDAAMLPGVIDVSKNTAFLESCELAKTMADILQNEIHSYDLGEKCYARATKYTWTNIIKEFEKSYRLALENNKESENTRNL